MEAKDSLKGQVIEFMNSELEEAEHKISRSNRAALKLQKEVFEKDQLLDETTAKLSNLQEKQLSY